MCTGGGYWLTRPRPHVGTLGPYDAVYRESFRRTRDRTLDRWLYCAEYYVEVVSGSKLCEPLSDLACGPRRPDIRCFQGWE